jgi:hypothetical protein
MRRCVNSGADRTNGTSTATGNLLTQTHSIPLDHLSAWEPRFPGSQGRPSLKIKEVETMRVEVYRNLHRGCWSVRSSSTGRVIAHAERVQLEDVRLVVQPAGRARVLREQRKNVHAFMRGELTHLWKQDEWSTIDSTLDLYPRMPEGQQVSYNPYRCASFVMRATGETIQGASSVTLTETGHAYIGS